MNECKPLAAARRLSWAQRYRLEWIAEMLSVYGFINRGHLMRKFDISKPQAAIDMRLFEQIYPGVMTYNASARRYEAAQGQRGGAGGA